MAGKVFISEYQMTTIRGVQMLKAPPLVVQVPITSSGSHQEFSAFNGSTEAIRIAVDGGGAVCIKFGTAPAATTNDERWAANQTEHRAVAPGDTISIISSPT
jgi:hypothetical protein